jgi:hypothetical protein
MLSTSKRGYPTEFVDSTQNHHTISVIGTPNQSIRMNIFKKKVYLVPQKCKGAKNSYEDYSTEFAPNASNITGFKFN